MSEQGREGREKCPMVFVEMAIASNGEEVEDVPADELAVCSLVEEGEG